MKTIFWKIFNVVAGCASVLGVVYLFFTDKEIGVLALTFFSIFLLGVLIAVWVGVIKMIKKEYNEEYKKITSFTSYETNDGVHGVYEVFKVIQSKRVFLQHVDHNFKWSGSRMPMISSELQEIKQVIDNVCCLRLMKMAKRNGAVDVRGGLLVRGAGKSCWRGIGWFA